MVRNHVLHPIVDAAARLGEEVLSSRAAQKAFERRSVHKYVFTVAPLRCAAPLPTQRSSGGGRGRGVAVFPELGQVVSVSGKSTLVAHRESLSLQYLRRSFLRIGRRAAWGKVRKVDVLLSWACRHVLTFHRLVWHSKPSTDISCWFPSTLRIAATFALCNRIRQRTLEFGIVGHSDIFSFNVLLLKSFPKRNPLMWSIVENTRGLYGRKQQSQRTHRAPTTRW